MKCPNCGGTGKEYWNGNVFCNTGFECDKCNGTGNVEQNNEEWFCQLNTIEKAEIIAQLSSYGGNVEAILKWLKQPHKPIS